MPASRSARATIFTPRSWPSSPTLAINTRTGGAMAANCTVLPSAHPMTSDPSFFRDLAWVIVAAVAGGALAWLARQPLILGYVVGGILVGRFTPGPTVSDTHTFELFAEIGVVLLMFSVGIEFSLRDLLRVRWVALLGGPLGIVLTAALGAGAGVVLGWPPGQGLGIGLVISVASTMVLVRLLMDRGELHTRHGRVMIGISLVEDLAVVAMTVLLPALGAGVTERPIAVAIAFGKAALVLVPALFLAARVVPALMRRVARTQNDELFLLVVLAIGLGTGALTQAVGLAVALGAFLAGLIISTSDYAHETIARLLPLRDVFVAMFFVTVGMLVDPFTVAANLPLLAALIVLIVVGKAVIRFAIVRLFGYPWATAARVGVGLAQIGEFSFILVQVARGAGLVGDDVYNATLAASLFSILFNALLVRHVPGWLDALWHFRARAPSAAEATRSGGVVLCGFGRVGSEIGEALETFEVPYTVIERDPDICAQLRARGVPCVFGAAATVALPEVRELALGAGGVTDRSLRDARIRERFGVTVVAIRRADGLVLNPPPDTMLRAGDVVRVFGLTDQIEAFAAESGR